MESGLFKVKILGLVHARTNVNWWPGQTLTQQLNHLESKFEDLQVCSVNVGALRGLETTPGILSCRSVDTSCVQKTRYRGKSVGMISGKATKYKLFWIGNEKFLGGIGIFLIWKWVHKVSDISKVSNRINVIKVLVQ